FWSYFNPIFFLQRGNCIGRLSLEVNEVGLNYRIALVREDERNESLVLRQILWITKNGAERLEPIRCTTRNPQRKDFGSRIVNKQDFFAKVRSSLAGTQSLLEVVCAELPLRFARNQLQNRLEVVDLGCTQ